MVATPLVLLANRWTWQLSSYQNRLRYKKFWTENSWRGSFCWTETMWLLLNCILKKARMKSKDPNHHKVQAGLVEQEPWQPNLNSRNPYEVLARKAWLSAFNMRMIWHECFNQYRTNPCIIHWFGPFPNSPHLRISATSDDWLDTSRQEYKKKQKSHFLHSVSQFTV